MELATLYQVLMVAKTAEEVFGTLVGDRNAMLEGVRRAFRSLARVAHPDMAGGDGGIAAEAFTLLSRWRERAEEAIGRGDYGRGGAEDAGFRTRRGTYAMGPVVCEGDYFTLYRCSTGGGGAECLLKVVGAPADNDLLEGEWQMLERLAHETGRGARYLPRAVERVTFAEGSGRRNGLVLASEGATVPLTAVREAYPAGLDPRDAAWMFNRLVEGLWFVHEAGLVHGAVTPGNALVRLKDHGMHLHEWAYAVEAGQPLRAVSMAHESWYPAEAFGRGVGPALDLTMAVRCLVYLLGGEPVSGSVPGTVPGALVRFVRGCLGVPWARQPTDAAALREEFGECMRSVYGPRRFRPLAMPSDAVRC